MKPKPPFRVVNLSVRATKYADILIQELEPKRMGASPFATTYTTLILLSPSPSPPVKRKHRYLTAVASAVNPSKSCQRKIKVKP